MNISLLFLLIHIALHGISEFRQVCLLNDAQCGPVDLHKVQVDMNVDDSNK